MSKTRTGRKGRARLALAQALGSIDSAVGDATVVDADGRLGTSSGFRSADEDKTNAQILDVIQRELHKPGTANALFQQGEVRGALPDSVDTQNGASGAISSADSGAFAAVSGEAGALGISPLTNSGGSFAHYVLPAATEAATNDLTAITAAAGGAITTATAQVSQIVSTDKFGICYHQGGPGSDFVPLRDSGAAAANDMAATQIVINPSSADVWSDSNVGTPTSLRVEVVGRGVSAKDANAADDGGDALTIYPTTTTTAKAVIKFKTVGTGAAALASFADGHELKVRNADGNVVLTVVGHLGANGGSTLAAEAAPGGNVQDKNFDATTDAASNILYVIPHASDAPDGATAYPGGGGTAAGGGVGQFVANLVAGINALSDARNLGITAAPGSGVNEKDELTLTFDRYRGTEGNNTTNANEAALTVTAYSSSGQILVPALAAHAYFGDADNSLAGGADAAASRVLFDGGENGTAFGGTPTSVTGTDFDTAVSIDQKDFPVRVAYVSDDAAREGIGSGAKFGVGSAMLDCNFLLQANGDADIVFSVPAAQGGQGTTTIKLDVSKATDPEGEGNGAIAVGTNALAAGAVAARIVAAVNGVVAGQGATEARHIATAGNGQVLQNTAGTAGTALSSGVVGVEAEDMGGGLVQLHLGGDARGAVSSCSVTCTDSVKGIKFGFTDAGVPAYSSAGFAVIWGLI